MKTVRKISLYVGLLLISLFSLDATAGEIKLLSLKKPIKANNTDLLYHKVEYLVDSIQIPSSYTEKWCTYQNKASFIIDLQSVYLVSRFVTYDCKVKESFDNVNDYDIYVSLEDPSQNKWTKVVEKRGAGGNDIKTDDINPIEARYIRYEVAEDVSKKAIRMYEFEVWGDEVDAPWAFKMTYVWIGAGVVGIALLLFLLYIILRKNGFRF